ncbi:MAG: EAL domain-containing protein (putative c-di-GMP-specific phosphodiesterase class I) [Halieaceae bacterium]|jgi:EAL domain-containing protein (putative c-di-GMP-specific phosphodiesterase class I)/GGDEF domain-containing protein
MIPSPTSNVLGLIELVDSDGLCDTYGPDSFKDLRNVFVDRLKHWTRENDHWNMLGNDRFCVVLDGVSSRAQIELAAAKLERMFEEPHYIFNTPVKMEIKAGFANVRSNATDTDAAVRQASMALHEARKSPQGFAVYSPQCEQSYVDKRQLVRELETAVEVGELELYYQPKIHAGFRSLVGAEALMRWHTKDGTVRHPDEFMPVAERNDVIRPMTWWAIKSAVSRLARWPEHLSISVNVTPTLLLDDEILAVVGDSLDIYGVKPERLTLEVTESIMVQNQKIMLNKLAQIRGMGARISIDDFGTGFSSLAYFRDLPADEIKIDKCFVIPMLKSEKDRAIVKAVIDLAHNFSLKVVAEGVETEEITKELASMRCDVLQGFAYDAPLLVQDFEKRYLY